MRETCAVTGQAGATEREAPGPGAGTTGGLSGDPAVMGRRASLRPVILRPCLSTGLPFADLLPCAGDSAALCAAAISTNTSAAVNIFQPGVADSSQPGARRPARARAAIARGRAGEVDCATAEAGDGLSCAIGSRATVGLSKRSANEAPWNAHRTRAQYPMRIYAGGPRLAGIHR